MNVEYISCSFCISSPTKACNEAIHLAILLSLCHKDNIAAIIAKQIASLRASVGVEVQNTTTNIFTVHYFKLRLKQKQLLTRE